MEGPQHLYYLPFPKHITPSLTPTPVTPSISHNRNPHAFNILPFPPTNPNSQNFTVPSSIPIPIPIPMPETPPMENYPRSSSPPSREVETENKTPPFDEPPSKNSYKVTFLCSYGGKILPKAYDNNNLGYVGGETKIMAVDRSIKFYAIMEKLSMLCDNSEICIKYQLPGEDLDALISVINDEDLEHMMVEYDRVCRGSTKPGRLRLVLFPLNASLPVNSAPENELKSEQKFFLEGSSPPATVLDSATARTVPAKDDQKAVGEALVSTGDVQRMEIGIQVEDNGIEDSQNIPETAAPPHAQAQAQVQVQAQVQAHSTPVAVSVADPVPLPVPERHVKSGGYGFGVQRGKVYSQNIAETVTSPPLQAHAQVQTQAHYTPVPVSDSESAPERHYESGLYAMGIQHGRVYSKNIPETVAPPPLQTQVQAHSTPFTVSVRDSVSVAERHVRSGGYASGVQPVYLIQTPSGLYQAIITLQPVATTVGQTHYAVPRMAPAAHVYNESSLFCSQPIHTEADSGLCPTEWGGDSWN